MRSSAVSDERRMDGGRFYTATAETKLQHAELCRASGTSSGEFPCGAHIVCFLLPTTPVRGESPACARKPPRVISTGLLTGSAQIKCDRREPGDREQHADKVGP